MKSIIKIILIIYLFHLCPAQAEQPDSFLRNKPVQGYFIPNCGQWDDKILFTGDFDGLKLWITKESLLFNFYKVKSSPPVRTFLEMFGLENSFERKGQEKPNIELMRHVVEMKPFLSPLSQKEARGINSLNISRGQIQCRKKISSYLNYYLDSDSSRWRHHVPVYDEIEIDNILPGVDMLLTGENGSLRYNFIIHAGTSPEDFSLNFEGKDTLFINGNNEIVLGTALGNVYNKDIMVFQGNGSNRNELNSRMYVSQGNKVTFQVNAIDLSEAVTIDPLVYSSFFGDSFDEYSYKVASDIDDMGNMYIGGDTGSWDLPVTLGAYQTQKYPGGGTFFASFPIIMNCYSLPFLLKAV